MWIKLQYGTKKKSLPLIYKYSLLNVVSEHIICFDENAFREHQNMEVFQLIFDIETSQSFENEK